MPSDTPRKRPRWQTVVGTAAGSWGNSVEASHDTTHCGLLKQADKHNGPSKTPPTLTVINPKTCTNVGQRVQPSAEDFAAVDYLYGRVTSSPTPIVASDQTPGQLDVFVADRFGSVAVKWVQGAGVWQGAVEISAPGSVAPGQALATARQTDNQIDLFFVDRFGAVNVMWVIDGGVWQGPVGLTPRETAVAGAPLATARQTDNQIDLFFVDRFGAVNVMWVIDGGVWQGPVVI